MSHVRNGMPGSSGLRPLLEAFENKEKNFELARLLVWNLYNVILGHKKNELQRVTEQVCAHCRTAQNFRNRLAVSKIQLNTSLPS
jgi:hypothetical protein